MLTIYLTIQLTICDDLELNILSKIIYQNRSIVIILVLYCLVYGYNLSGMSDILYDELLYSDTAFQFSTHFHFINKLGGLAANNSVL